MGGFFSKGPAAPRIAQVTANQNQPQLTVEQIIDQRQQKKNKEILKLIENELLPNIITSDKLSMICHNWFRKNSVKQELNYDVIKVIIQHSQFQMLEYKLTKKIIETNGDIHTSFQWFFEQTNMKFDQQLIVEILATNREYINDEYMSKYLENDKIAEISRINYLKLCGITESLGGIEECMRYFFAKCSLYIPSMHINEYQLLLSAFTKTMILNGNIKNEIHRKHFENDANFLLLLIHHMFWSTAGAKHYRNISQNPSNPIMAQHAEKHGVMADIMELFENQPLQMSHGTEEIQAVQMVQYSP